MDIISAVRSPISEKRRTGRLDGVDGNIKGLQLQIGKLTMMENALRRCSGGKAANGGLKRLGFIPSPYTMRTGNTSL